MRGDEIIAFHASRHESPRQQRSDYGISTLTTVFIDDREIHLANFSILSIAVSTLDGVHLPAAVTTIQ